MGWGIVSLPPPPPLQASVEDNVNLNGRHFCHEETCRGGHNFSEIMQVMVMHIISTL